MRSFVRCVVVVFAALLSMRVTASTWSLRFNNLTQEGNSVDAVPGGGFVASALRFTGKGLMIVRLDDQGSVLWERGLNVAPDSLVSGGFVRASSDGGFCVAASIAPPSGAYDVLLAKLDASGNIVWQLYGGGPLADLADSVTALADGGCLLVSESPQATGPSALWVLRTDSTGGVAWSKTFDTPDLDLNGRMHELAGGDLLLSGASLRTSQQADGLVARLSADGSILWQRRLEGPPLVVPWAVAGTAAGEVALGGFAGNGGQSGGFLAKLDARGGLMWALGYAGPARIEAIALDAGGGIAAAGSTFEGLASADGWTLVTDAAGAVIAATTHGGTGSDGLRDIVRTPDGGLAVAGFVSPDPFFGSTLYVAKADASGHVGVDCSFIAPRSVSAQARPIKSREGSMAVAAFVPSFSASPVTADDNAVPPVAVCSGP